jgi:FKBP-type peptidyl-prolyl cis-trans isomerase SlyD
MAVQVVSFHCVLKDKSGRVISSTFNNEVLTSGPGSHETLKALSEGLQDLQKGERRSISLSAEQAYGFYQPDLVVIRPIDELSMSGPVIVGESIVYETNGKRGHYRVTEISLDSVTLDGNHPLAGQDLVFEIEALAAREATAAELIETRSYDEASALH